MCKTLYVKCTLLGYYAPFSANSLPTFRDNLIGPEISVRNWHYTLHKSLSERSSHLLRGGSLKFSNILCLMFISWNRLVLRLSGQILLWKDLVPVSAILVLMPEDFEALLSVSHYTARSTHTTAWNTCCHNTANHITMYFYWSAPHYFRFSKAQHKLPEDGPIGPKRVGANIEIF